MTTSKKTKKSSQTIPSKVNVGGNVTGRNVIMGNGNRVEQINQKVNTGDGGDFVGRDKVVGLQIGELYIVQSPLGARPAELQYAFDSFITDRTKDFVGRRFVFDAITQFMEEKTSGYFFVRGDPGIGKSAIAAQLVKQHGCVHHFNIRAEGISKTEQFLGNVCAQLITAYQLEHPVLPPRALKDAEFMKGLLDEISSRMPSNKKVLIVVDALDEVSEETEANILCLPKTLPKGIYIIATMRRVDIPLLFECEQDTLYIVHDSADNLGDVREYVSGWVEKKGIRTYIAAQKITVELFVDHLVRQSEGNFMYLRYVLPEIERGVYGDLGIENLPKGLEGYYDDHWRRMGMTAKLLPRDKIRIVYILSEVRQPVSRNLIAQFADSNDMKVDELAVQNVLDNWDQFLHKHSSVDGTRYSVYHATFREFLHRKDIVQAAGITIQGIHKLIAGNLLNDLFG